MRWHPGPAGEPVIEDCAAFLHCTVERHVPAGDHVLVLARVTGAHVARVGSPLIYHDGGYATVGPAPDLSEGAERRAAAQVSYAYDRGKPMIPFGFISN